MRLKILFQLLILTQFISAQTFVEASPSPFDDVRLGSIAFSDVDGDGDEDVLITGENLIIGSGDRTRIAKLYTNDGGGIFTEVMDTPFDGVWLSSIAFSDVDGNGKEDVLITGSTDLGLNESIAKLYTNDGASFTEVMNTPFEGVLGGAVAFSDIDGDGDEDVLITGEIATFESSTKLYINEGDISSTREGVLPFSLNIKTYPNPTDGSKLYVDYNSAENSFVTINVYDVNGQLLRQQKELAIIGEQTFVVTIAALA